MLNEHTLDQLRSLRLDGMVRAIEEQTTSTAAATLSFDERLTGSSPVVLARFAAFCLGSCRVDAGFDGPICRHAM